MLHAGFEVQISSYITCTTEAGSIWHATDRDHIKVYNFRESESSRLAIVAGDAYKDVESYDNKLYGKL